MNEERGLEMAAGLKDTRAPVRLFLKAIGRALERLELSRLTRIAVTRALQRWRGASGQAEPVWLFGSGKGVMTMALGAEQALGEQLAGGLLVGKFGPPAGAPLKTPWRLGEHPLPGPQSFEAGGELLAAVAQLPPSARAIYLLSGGTSALVERPIAGLTADDIRAITAAALASSLDISQLNGLRVQLSAIKNGGLAQAFSGQELLTLAVSDVADAPPWVIGSGPTLQGNWRRKDAQESFALLRSQLERAGESKLATRVAAALQMGPNPATVPSNPPQPAWELLADWRSLRAEVARALGDDWQVVVLQAPVSGPADKVAESLLARREALGAATGPRVIFGVGETTASLPKNPGAGGRCQHAALAAAKLLSSVTPERHSKLWFCAFASDGNDGPDGGAGGVVCAVKPEEQRALEAALAAFSSQAWLKEQGAWLDPGQTHNNLGDIYAIFEEP